IRHPPRRTPFPYTTLFRSDADLARFDAALGRHPHAVVTPDARAEGHLLRLPVVGIDDAAAPAVLDHEAGRRVGIERGHLVVDVRSEEHTSELQSRENLVCR